MLNLYAHQLEGLDFAAGSFTTGVACVNLKRKTLSITTLPANVSVMLTKRYFNKGKGNEQWKMN